MKLSTGSTYTLDDGSVAVVRSITEIYSIDVFRDGNYVNSVWVNPTDTKINGCKIAYKGTQLDLFSDYGNT